MRLISSKKGIQRYNLDKCYSFGMYNKTIKYGREHEDINGVSNWIEKLNSEENSYSYEMENIINSEREIENKKYSSWEKCNKIKKTSFRMTLILLFLIPFVNICFIGPRTPDFIRVLSMIATLILLLSFFTAIFSIPFEIITKKIYQNYVLKLYKKIQEKNRLFENVSYSIYQNIDNLYLNTLEPIHRDNILMHRKQEEHNRKMEQIAEEQRKLDVENLNERKRSNELHSRLLNIEEERERRYNKW